MPPTVALLLGAIFVYVAFRSDRKRNVANTKALIWPTLWYTVVASHPLGYWLQLWGVSLPGGSDDPTEGSIVDRFFFLALTAIGLWILARRKFNWAALLRRNPWPTALVAFMFVSVLWSHYPFVSFKRFTKVIGSIVMAMIVLTDENPKEACFTVLRRCLYIHLPMSIICTRYFRGIGVTFEWNGSVEEWQGISTAKNTLGQVAMLGVLYFFWEVKRHWRQYRWRNLHVLYLLMALYLLKGSEKALSLTSISVCLFALVIFLRIHALRSRPASVRPFVLTVFSGTVALVLLVLVHSVVMFSPDSLFGKFITVFGRDITLTGRTDIWSDCYAATASNPLLGVGFGAFWIGREANIPWNANMTWILGQAHSGYVDTYLQLGFVGAFLLAGTMFSSLGKLLHLLYDDFSFSCFRITLLLTVLFVDITESIYLRGDHHLWLLLQIAWWSVPTARPMDPVISHPNPA